MNREICKLFASVSKYSVDDWLTLMDGNDHVFTAEQLYETGFLTEIREPDQNMITASTETKVSPIVPITAVLITGLLVWMFAKK